ncbi:hypothetical protein KLPMCK367M_23785 [Klebsiella pneumoniae]
MKKYSRGMASFVVMMMLSPVAAQAADGKVTFNGEVIENTCTVVNNGKRLPGNNFKITLFVIPIANITTIYTHHKRFSWPGQVPPVAGAAGKKT